MLDGKRCEGDIPFRLGRSQWPQSDAVLERIDRETFENSRFYHYRRSFKNEKK